MPGILVVCIWTHCIVTHLAPHFSSLSFILLTLTTLFIPANLFQAHYTCAPTSGSAGELCMAVIGGVLLTPPGMQELCEAP